MTNKELSEQLKKLPENATIKFSYYDSDYDIEQINDIYSIIYRPIEGEVVLA